MDTSTSKMEHGLTPVFVVGRHAPDLGDTPVVIVGSAAPTFSLNRDECAQQLIEIDRAANAAGTKHVLLQNVPAAVAGALFAHLGRTQNQWGVVVSVPGERQAGVSKTFKFEADPDEVDPFFTASTAVKMVEKAVKFVNARATTAITLPGDGYMDNYIASITVTVDPVTPFVFSHIDWLNTPPTSIDKA